MNFRWSKIHKKKKQEKKKKGKKRRKKNEQEKRKAFIFLSKESQMWVAPYLINSLITDLQDLRPGNSKELFGKVKVNKVFFSQHSSSSYQSGTAKFLWFS
jgi:hypothetical protein